MFLSKVRHVKITSDNQYFNYNKTQCKYCTYNLIKSLKYSYVIPSYVLGF